MSSERVYEYKIDLSFIRKKIYGTIVFGLCLLRVVNSIYVIASNTLPFFYYCFRAFNFPRVFLNVTEVNIRVGFAV